MENAPLTPETGFDKDLDSEKDRAKNKRSRLGLVAVEAGPGAARKSPEHIGHVVVTAEAKPEDRKAELPPGQRVETIDRRELLEFSERIIIDGSSLRQIYETHLIGERGLRRLVQEYLRGGDLRKALRMEVTEREIDFERDPALRDMGQLDAGVGQPGPGGQTGLKKMVEQAAAKIPANEERTAFYKAREVYEANRQLSRRRRLVDITLGAIIALLTITAIAVYIIR